MYPARIPCSWGGCRLPVFHQSGASIQVTNWVPVIEKRLGLGSILGVVGPLEQVGVPGARISGAAHKATPSKVTGAPAAQKWWHQALSRPLCGMTEASTWLHGL